MRVLNLNLKKVGQGSISIRDSESWTGIIGACIRLHEDKNYDEIQTKAVTNEVALLTRKMEQAEALIANMKAQLDAASNGIGRNEMALSELKDDVNKHKTETKLMISSNREKIEKGEWEKFSRVEFYMKDRVISDKAT